MQITTEEFDKRMQEKIATMRASEIIGLPSVYEALSDYLNDEIVQEWEQEQLDPEAT